MKAVVMAGGEGSRLRPLTVHRPKPLVPVGNRPIMGHILGLLHRHGFNDVLATVHYLAPDIQAAFGDGSEHGVSLQYFVEDTPLGTAGSVKMAESALRDETFVIVSGDALTDCDLTAALAFHRAKQSLATLVLYRVASPLEYGVVIVNEEGRIQRFLEKPSWSEVFSDTVNTGIYILEPEVLATMEAGRNYDWSRDIFPRLLREDKPIYGYVMNGYWADVGSLTSYREAQDHLLDGDVDLKPAGVRTAEGNWIGPNCQIDPDAVLVAPVCIGEGTRIKAGAEVGPYATLGDHAFVEEGATIERSVVGDSAYLGPNVQLRGAIVGSRATIKKDSVVFEDAVVGDRCLIDVGCVIRPRVKLWPDKVIERGSTVTMSLIYGNKWHGSIFRTLGVAGLSNIEITPEFATRLGSAFGTCLPPGSKIVTSRDSTRSSRMIKRAVIASLLSVGCDVLDLRSASVPVARHFIRSSGAAGAVNIRKLPGNSRITLIELFDKDGAYLAKDLERKVETLFFREDFRRTDPDDLGVIEFASRAIEEYQADFFRELKAIAPQGPTRRLRVVCDFGYSALASILPSMLDQLDVDVVSLNTFNNAKLAPRTTDEVARHIENVRQIVGSLGYDLGVLFTNEGERLTVVDGQGRPLTGLELFGVLGILYGEAHPGTQVSVSVTAPDRLVGDLRRRGLDVRVTKSDAPSIYRGAGGSAFAADDAGGFVFPRLHAGFDGAFAFAALLALLEQSGKDLRSVVAELPSFAVGHVALPCDLERKGSVMRLLAERYPEADMTDGVKFSGGDGYCLVLPDAMEPILHLFAEGGCETTARAHVQALQAQVES